MHKNALHALYAALEAIPDAGTVGALLKNSDSSVQTSCVLPFPTILNQAFDFEWLRRRFPRAKIFGAAAAFSDLQKPQCVDAVSGACIMMSRALFLEIGMFSTDYFMYAEDIDLCHKVKLSDRKVYLVTTAEITHFGGGSSTGSKHSRQSAVLLRDSNFKLLCKFRGRGYAHLYRASLAAAAVARLTALLVMLIPAAVTGRGATVIDALLRWGYLLGWAVRIRSAPHSFGAGTKKP